MKNTTKLVVGKWYRIQDATDTTTHAAQYTGRQSGYSCTICGKGCKAHTFNIWYNNVGYETWGYGTEHLPAIVEEIEADAGDIVIDK